MLQRARDAHERIRLTAMLTEEREEQQKAESNAAECDGAELHTSAVDESATVVAPTNTDEPVQAITSITPAITVTNTSDAQEFATTDTANTTADEQLTTSSITDDHISLNYDNST